MRLLPTLLLALAPALLPADEPDPRWEEAKTPKEHFDRVAATLAEDASTLGGRVLIVWLVDRSGSMKDDRDELRARVEEIFRRVPAGKARLRMAVVGFGAEPAELLAPSESPDEVAKALEDVPPDESGRELVVAAGLYALQRYDKLPDRKLLVLLSDERGDDDDRVEELVDALKRKRSRCYDAIAREAPFHALSAQEATGNPACPTVTVTAGPEAPELEVFRKDAQDLMNVPSGFGSWMQARLCRESGGRLFLFRSGNARLSAAPDYDRELLERDYAPPLCSREEYAKSARKGSLLAAGREAVAAVDAAPLRRGTLLPGDLKRQLETDVASIRAKRKVVDAHLEALGKALKADYRATKREQANAELLVALLLRERFNLQAEEESLAAALAKPLPEMKPEERAYFDRKLQGWTPHSAGAEAMRAEAERAFAGLAQRHARTPWAAAARTLRVVPGLFELVVFTPKSTPLPKY